MSDDTIDREVSQVIDDPVRQEDVQDGPGGPLFWISMLFGVGVIAVTVVRYRAGAGSPGQQSTARFLLGDPSPGDVRASIGTRYARGRYTVDDDGLVLISWSTGTQSLVETGWWQPHLGGLEADTEVFGTGGYARIWDTVPPTDDYEHCTQPMYSAQVAEFLDAIEQGRPPHPSGRDGRVVIQVVQAAYADSADHPVGS